MEPECYERGSWSSDFCECFKKMRQQKRNQLLFIHTGDSHTIMSGNRGSVYQWGSSDLFQLGFSKSNRSDSMGLSSKVRETLGGDITSIQTGFNHSIAYNRYTGRLVVWGDNSQGQLMDDSFRCVPNIVDISNILSTNSIVSMQAVGNHTSIVLSNGSGLIWPYQDETGKVVCTPMRAAFGREKVSSISLGLDFSVFVLSDGSIYTMGTSNSRGELGHGDTRPRYIPMKVGWMVDKSV